MNAHLVIPRVLTFVERQIRRTFAEEDDECVIRAVQP